MKYETYELIVSDKDFEFLEFVSVGRHGSIPKKIVFTDTGVPEIYNLAFGDVDKDGEINDYSISDNGDRNKILATIVKAVNMYTMRHPDRLIYFEGSTSQRTRLYRMAIGINLEELSYTFEISAKGPASPLWLPFEKNMQITSIIVKRKIN